MIFHENRLLADVSHEISYLIFSKIRKDVAKLSSAADVMVRREMQAQYVVTCLLMFITVTYADQWSLLCKLNAYILVI